MNSWSSNKSVPYVTSMDINKQKFSKNKIFPKTNRTKIKKKTRMKSVQKKTEI